MCSDDIMLYDLPGKPFPQASTNKIHNAGRYNVIVVRRLQYYTQPVRNPELEDRSDAKTVKVTTDFFQSNLAALTFPVIRGWNLSSLPELLCPNKSQDGEAEDVKVWVYEHDLDSKKHEDPFYRAAGNGISVYSHDLIMRIEREIDNQDPIIFVDYHPGISVIKNVLDDLGTRRERVKAAVFLLFVDTGPEHAMWSGTRIEMADDYAERIQHDLKTLLYEGRIDIHGFSMTHHRVKTDNVPSVNSRPQRPNPSGPVAGHEDAEGREYQAFIRSLKQILYSKIFWSNNTDISCPELCRFCHRMTAQIIFPWPLNQGRRASENKTVVDRDISDLVAETACPLCRAARDCLLPYFQPISRGCAIRRPEMRRLTSLRKRPPFPIGFAQFPLTAPTVSTVLSDWRVSYVKLEDHDSEKFHDPGRYGLNSSSTVSSIQQLARLRVAIKSHDSQEITYRCIQQFAEDDTLHSEDDAREKNPVRSSKFLLGRKMGNQVDIGLIKMWLTRCDSMHGATCRPRTSKRPPAQFMVIDIRARMVCNPIKEEGTLEGLKYAALSYVWGPPSISQLKNVQEGGVRAQLYQKGGLDKLWEEVPYTIRDAITLCLETGIRYLWVDALCIEQDNIQNEEVFDSMCDIYSSAYVTIVNVSATHSWDRLPGAAPGTRHVHQNVTKVGGIWVGAAQLPRYKKVQESVWFQRGWTLQEALLSKRLLMFTPDEVLFECEEADEGWCESMHLEQPFSVNNGRFRGLSCFRVKQRHPEGFTRWGSFLMQYGQRQLTSQSDTIRAYAGITRSIADTEGSSVFLGVIMKYFHDTLAFAVDATVRQRRHLFPSWCWAEWAPLNRAGFKTYKFHGVYAGEDLEPTAIIYHLESKRTPKQTSLGMESLVYTRLAAGYPFRLGRIRESYRASSLSIDLRALRVPPQNILLIDAETGKVPVSREGVQTDSYTDAAGNEIPIFSYSILFDLWYYNYGTERPKIELDDDWRQRQHDELEFLALGIIHVNKTSQIRDIYTFLIETDRYGISHRVTSLYLGPSEWNSTKPKRRLVYLA